MVESVNFKIRVKSSIFNMPCFVCAFPNCRASKRKEPDLKFAHFVKSKTDPHEAGGLIGLKNGLICRLEIYLLVAPQKKCITEAFSDRFFISF